MTDRDRLVELIQNALAAYGTEANADCKPQDFIADFILANGVTVQKHGYWETVVEVKDNTVCGNGARIEYKRCSCCENPAKFFEDDFCGNCGAKLDLPQPPTI